MLPIQMQLSVELTNVFGAVAAALPWKKILDLGRDLRKSGSDILVEEDLANVFGRGKIVHALENRFKHSIKDTKIVPLHPTCSITLQSGPGPTVTRAMRDQDRRYMSTVIQLSFLGAVFNRTELATALTECMSKRLTYGIQDSSGPGYEDIAGVLEACSSQTSTFDWYPHIEAVEQRIRKHFGYFDENGQQFRRDSRPIKTVPIHLLLAAMDYLYLAQSLPEDRKLFCNSEKGVIPIVIWAHTILGLTVAIRSLQHEDLIFGMSSASSQVIIQWRAIASIEVAAEDSEILLLDRSMKVILKTIPDSSMESDIETEERHNLQSFGSRKLYRVFNSASSISDETPIYQDLIECILAVAIIRSRKIERQKNGFSTSSDGERSEPSDSRYYSLEYWRIASAGAVLFHRQISKLNDNKRQESMLRVEKWVEAFQNMNLKTARDIPLPQSVRLHLDKLGQVGGTHASMSHRIFDLSNLVLVIAHIANIDQCSTLPICANTLLQLWSNGDFMMDLKVKSHTIFGVIANLLVGPEFHQGEYGDYKHAFLISDFGWSVSLDCIGDKNPSDVRVHLVSVRPGVPTNQRGERKSKIRDAELLGGASPGQRIEDEGLEMYRPRSERIVTDRTEYYGSRNKEFWFSLRLDIPRTVEDMKKRSINDRIWDDYTSYRELHDALWDVDIVLDGKMCHHSVKSLEAAKLGVEIATISGWPTYLDERDDIPQRICICLTKNDWRARWLAIKHFIDDPTRRIALRGTECCEDCALDTVVALPDQWILIL
jgi:hypothetical protein